MHAYAKSSRDRKRERTETQDVAMNSFPECVYRCKVNELGSRKPCNQTEINSILNTS